MSPNHTIRPARTGMNRRKALERSFSPEKLAQFEFSQLMNQAPVLDRYFTLSLSGAVGSDSSAAN